MAHFAKLDENNVVLEVLVVHNNELLDAQGNESEAKGVAFLQKLLGWESWKQTSYNGNFRKHYAGIGYTYDAQRDAFIPHKEFPSWVLDEDTLLWHAPIPYPEGGSRQWVWNEEGLNWVEASSINEVTP